MQAVIGGGYNGNSWWRISGGGGEVFIGGGMAVRGCMVVGVVVGVVLGIVLGVVIGGVASL